MGVPDKTNHGGKRPGAGNKAGSVRTAEPRTIRKANRWTKPEWLDITTRAKAMGLSDTGYQRYKILKED